MSLCFTTLWLLCLVLDPLLGLTLHVRPRPTHPCRTPRPCAGLCSHRLDGHAVYLSMTPLHGPPVTSLTACRSEWGQHREWWKQCTFKVKSCFPVSAQKLLLGGALLCIWNVPTSMWRNFGGLEHQKHWGPMVFQGQNPDSHLGNHSRFQYPEGLWSHSL